MASRPYRQEPRYHPDEFLTRTELAEWLKVSLSTVDRLRRDAGLPYVIFGQRAIRFRVGDVQRWLQRRPI